MKKRTRILALAMVLCMALALAACGGDGGGDSSTKDSLVVVVDTEPSSLDPHNLNMVTGFTIGKLIMDRLFTADAEYNISNSLATGYTWVDDTTLQVDIRTGVTFTDGDPLTAEDVVYTIKRACSMSQSATAFAPFDAENTKAVDEDTVEIKLHYAYPNAITVLAAGRACIVSQKSIEEMGEEAYGRAPVGSGKFKVSNWVAGDRIELVRNDDYWGDKPAYTNLTFRIITESASRAIEVETGNADIAFRVSSEDLSRLEADENVNIVKGPSSTMNHVVINTVNFDTLQNDMVREAMHMAIDKQAIVDVVYSGYAVVANSLVPSVTPSYAEIGIDYDPDAAKALLAQSGFDLSTELVLNIYKNTQIEAMAEMLANMWTEIGLNVKIEIMDRATMVTNNGQGKTFFYISSVTASDGNIESVFRMWETASYGFTGDAALRERLTAAKGIVDDAARAAEYATLQEICWNTHNVIPICTAENIFAVRAEVQGFEFHPDNAPDLSVLTFG